MARYIDVDEAIENIRNGDGTSMQKVFAECCLLAIPTADVVPKSEIAKIFAEIGKILYKYDKVAERDKSEYGELIVGDIGFAISELKKKYVPD